MKDKLAETIATYDRSAQNFANYFRSVNSARVKDIEIAFELLGNKSNPAVLEIGCADGRDAEEILTRTNNYIGFDISKELIKLACKNISEARFLVGDARTIEYPERLDIVFSFASLLHLDREELRDVFRNIHQALNDRGIFYLSLKRGDNYHSYVKQDKFGERLFFLYTPDDIKDLSKNYFKIENFSDGFVTDHETEWFEVALRKI